MESDEADSDEDGDMDGGGATSNDEEQETDNEDFEAGCGDHDAMDVANDSVSQRWEVDSH